MIVMSRPKKWKEMVNSSKDAIEDFRDFEDDKAIVWADTQISCYKEGMLALVRGNSDWAKTVSYDQEKLIETMVRRAIYV